VKRLALIGLVTICCATPSMAQEDTPRVAPENMRWVTPALADYTDEVLYGDVWRRTDLNLRDRSMVTVSALIAAGHTAQLTGHLNRALDNGVTPSEISGLITHLSFYAGWPNAVSALGISRPVLEKRGVTAGDIQAASAPLADGDRLSIVRKGTGPTSRGPAERFTGNVQVSSQIRGAGGAHIAGATVSFEAGARSAWHRHVLGQTLVVTEGCGWVQREGGPVETICAGDVATIAPQLKHWHGATKTSAMTHVALSQSARVEWLEQVSDAQYALGPR
jgi:4-carboxymuconolactone decarboxylase